MTPEEILKKGEALAKKVAEAKRLYDAASGAAKAEAKLIYDKVKAETQGAVKAISKKAGPAMQDLKKAGETGATIASFFSNPVGFMTKGLTKGGNPLGEIKDAASTIGSALKKGYDFSRKLDDTIIEGAKKVLPKVGEAAANVMTGGLYSAGKAVYEKGKDMVDLAGAAAKRAKDAEVRAGKGPDFISAEDRKKMKDREAGKGGAKKGTYAEAKKKDPKLDSYIAARKKLKKGTPEYNKIQGKINAAYGVGGRQVTPEKIEKRAVPQVETKTPKAELAGTPKSQTAAKPAVVKKKTTTDAGGRDAAKMVADEIKGDAPISKKEEASRREQRLRRKLEKERLKKRNKGGKIKAYNTGGKTETDPPKKEKISGLPYHDWEKEGSGFDYVQKGYMKGQMPTDEGEIRKLIKQAKKERYATVDKGINTGALMWKGKGVKGGYDDEVSAEDYYDKLLSRANAQLEKTRMAKREKSEAKTYTL